MQHRTHDFDRKGRIAAERETPMVSSSIRDTIGCLAKTFRERGRDSPFHVPNGVAGGEPLHPRIKDLLKGFASQDRPTSKQKAIPPDFLRDMIKLASLGPVEHRHMANLIIGAYFFAMRACEFCATEKPGKTKKLIMKNVTFRDRDNRIVGHNDHNLREKAEVVTICFEIQKNGTRMEKRSQKRTGLSDLCPVLAWASVISRVIEDFSGEGNPDDRPVCSYLAEGIRCEVTSTQVLKFLQATCELYEGEIRYGISPEEIGTRSIRSGAAMALAVQGGHSDREIMVLGRWKSTAFLQYIRPQVIEWSASMSKKMITVPKFLDLGGQESTATTQRNKKS